MTSRRGEELHKSVSTSTFREEEQNKVVEFFYKPHTISVLVFMLAYFLHVALVEQTDYTDSSHSVGSLFWWNAGGCTHDKLGDAKVGLIAVFFVFCSLIVLMFPPSPFIRPHPIFWRVATAMTAWYLLMLTFVLFQPKHAARQLLKDWFDSSLGVALGEKSYAADCDITSSWSQFKKNFLPQLFDVFVIAHSVGWFCKGLMLRDYYIGWILSVAFEFLEYSLQTQLPNFAECWWDHWILDVLVCNWLGLYCGMRACQYFEIKTYEWRGRPYSRMRRVVGQFTPLDWTKFEWAYTRSFKHFMTIILICIVFLQGELNAFYLKYLLWIPPSNQLNVIRLLLLFLSGTAAIKEIYQYLTDPTCKKLGHNAWLTIAVVQTETLICIKFSRGEGFGWIPWQWMLFWALIGLALSAYAVWKFLLYPHQPYYQSPSPSPIAIERRPLPADGDLSLAPVEEPSTKLNEPASDKYDAVKSPSQARKRRQK
ncbi:hypothetical protein MP228_001212 [Amoeboaphelidium protococcarum]|nr:hypothetical protein MP228_001212 [Amoeboaphelidium protococcarum]